MPDNLADVSVSTRVRTVRRLTASTPATWVTSATSRPTTRVWPSSTWSTTSSACSPETPTSSAGEPEWEPLPLESESPSSESQSPESEFPNRERVLESECSNRERFLLLIPRVLESDSSARNREYSFEVSSPTESDPLPSETPPSESESVIPRERESWSRWWWVGGGWC